MDVKTNPLGGAGMRRAPGQARSRDRVEQILAAAMELIREDGGTQLTMSAIAGRAGKTLPSIYRYFPDKRAVIETLAQRYMGLVREGIRETVAEVSNRQQARDAIRSLIRGYWELFRSEPAYRDILTAVQADRGLVHLDAEDSRANAEVLAEALGAVVPPDRADRLDTLALLGTHLTATVVRLALLSPEAEAEALIETWTDVTVQILLGDQA